MRVGLINMAHLWTRDSTLWEPVRLDADVFDVYVFVEAATRCQRSERTVTAEGLPRSDAAAPFTWGAVRRSPQLHKSRGGKVAVSTERPAFYRWEGFIKHGPTDVVKVIEEARKRRGRI